MQNHILITDVSPRDGLQNEPEILPVATKVALIERLLAAGVPRIELGSFVNPKQVPQMAGTAEVTAELRAHGYDLHDRRRFTALIPNLKGYELATAAGLGHVRLVLAASEGLNQANFKRSVAESITDFTRIAERAQADGIGFGIAIGAAFGCPFDGYVAPERVRDIAAQLIDLGADELILADTTGMAVPTQVAALCRMIIGDDAGGVEGRSTLRPYSNTTNVATTNVATTNVATTNITLHLHNTRNTGYANAFAAWQAGIRSFDASLGGIGGCPFAPRAVGNIATEDTVHMLNGMGAETGIDLAALLVASGWLSEQMQKSLPALVGKAEPVFTQVIAP